MKQLIQSSCLITIIILSACASNPNKPERGPEGTIAYIVEVDASEPDVRIEANNEYIGKTPTTLKIFGDKDGTFHNFGNFDYVVTASPPRAGEQIQTKTFKTGRFFTGEDRIPKKIFFEFGK